MWTEQNIDDAVNVLTSAGEGATIARVEAIDASYVVVNDVSYTDEIYLRALEQLIEDERLELAERGQGRETYRFRQ